MKTLKKILFMTLLVAGFSLTAMAQRDDNRNRPPKNDPPTIPAPDKKPPERPKDNNNNNKNRPKKPQDAIFISGSKIAVDLG